jgi:hypothetical protein
MYNNEQCPKCDPDRICECKPCAGCRKMGCTYVTCGCTWHS